MIKDRVTIQEAARRLGVKDDAIRKRIQRGSIEHDKDDSGRVYVYLEDATHDRSHDAYKDSTRYASRDGRAQDTSQDTTHDVLVGALDDQVQYLRGVIETRDRELETRAEELAEMRRIVAALTQRIPELPPAPREAPETTREEPGGVEDRGSPEKPPEAEEPRSWWRRMFGG